MARKRKKRSPLISILALVTTLVIATTFICLRGKSHQVQELTQLTDTNYTHQNVYIRDSRRTLLSSPIRKKRLADALWTMKPKIHKRWKNQKENLYIYDKVRGRALSKDVETESIDEDFSQTTPTFVENTSSLDSLAFKTTPSITDAPTNPIATQSVTTPLYTASPTSPITTESITTPSVTEPGEIEVTTELDIDDTNSDTLMMIRNRRGVVNGGTTTTPFPISSSSIKPPQCGDGVDSDPADNIDSDDDDDDDDDDDYYVGPNGDCECGINMSGPYCTDENDAAARQAILDRSLLYMTEAIGPFNNNMRAVFQEQLDLYYMDLPGFERAFILPMEYNATTNRTELSFYLVFNETTDADDASRSASLTANITGNILPIMIDNQPVSFGEESTFYVRPTIQNTVDLIPIGSKTLENVCYVYDQIGACLNGGGKCIERNGAPYCQCTEQYIGKYCTEEVKFLPTDAGEEIMVVLMPGLAAVAAVAAMCSCCFFFLRRVNKGDEVASIYSEESSWIETPKPVILPRYFPHSWRQMIAGPEAEEEEEEEYYSYSNVSAETEEVTPVIIERPVIQPVIVERVVYKERPVVPVAMERVVVPVEVERPVVPVAVGTSRFSEVGSEFSGQSVILPRFYPTPFRQLIPGPEVEDERASSHSGNFPRFYPTTFRQFTAGSEPDDADYQGRKILQTDNEKTSPSMVHPRFYTSQFRQFIPGSQAEDEEYYS